MPRRRKEEPAPAAEAGSTFAVMPSGPPGQDPIIVTHPGDSSTGWSDVVEQYRDAAWVAPVETDEAGETVSMPTGEVTVRFHEAPSDEAVEALARRHGAQVARRNELQPRQVVVTPTDHRVTYLPELCQRLQAEATVEQAWPNTRSRYRRA